ncbi:hypothetical protein POX_d05047 [Penicillium oxalicum]|uniref:hypothetical protein n=1 Tax=Penicillium oxalicum TaxID=69781 RepID=UPI0020B78551|nr:hypothetical protein POX_d05047 [Penicillium oxalicum]KAI2789554.1 hypothetical protein POX_d05047 [Penicillium oxalicum]
MSDREMSFVGQWSLVLLPKMRFQCGFETSVTDLPGVGFALMCNSCGLWPRATTSASQAHDQRPGYLW